MFDLVWVFVNFKMESIILSINMNPIKIIVCNLFEIPFPRQKDEEKQKFWQLDDLLTIGY